MTEEIKNTKKRPINSKRKGNSFEGHISKVLGETLSPMKFRRSQSSGAILGGSNKKFLEAFSADAKALFIGDVVPTNETDIIKEHGWRMAFTVECKSYKSVDTLDHLFNNTKITTWFSQACDDASKVEKMPLLIFKFNRTDTFIAIDPSVTCLPPKVTKSVTLKYDSNNQQKIIIIFLFKEALADPEWFKEFTKEN